MRLRTLLLVSLLISADDPKPITSGSRVQEMQEALLKIKALRVSGPRDSHLNKVEKSLKRAINAAKKKSLDKDPS